MLLKRITKRALESKISRDDDNSEILKNRILVYKKDTLPVLEYYKNLNKLHSIDGMQNVEDVSKDIQKLLDGKKIIRRKPSIKSSKSSNGKVKSTSSTVRANGTFINSAAPSASGAAWTGS